jgi:preprotein translocase subunit SecY
LSSLLKSIFLIPGLRAKILYTLAVLALVRLGSHVPIPGIDTNQLNTLFANNGLLGLADLFAGKALSNFSVFAMGILPYINASIIMQLMTILMPQLKEMAEEDNVFKRKIIIADWISLMGNVDRAMGGIIFENDREKRLKMVADFEEKLKEFDYMEEI